MNYKFIKEKYKVLFKLVSFMVILIFSTTVDSIAREKRDVALKIKDKKILYQLIVSVKGGANYFIRIGNNKWTGWGESYGFGGEFRIVFNKSNIGLGVSGGRIFETAVAEVPPDADIIWIRRVIRTPIIVKLFLNPKGQIRPWFGIGKDNFKIDYVYSKFELNGVQYEIEQEHLKGTEIFQIISIGVDAELWRNFILSGEIRFGINETNNTIKTTNFQSLQFLVGVGYKFSR